MPHNHNALTKPSQKNRMSSVLRLLRGIFSAAATTTTSVAGTDATKVKSLSQILYKEPNLEELVEKFKNASLDDHFRTRKDIYKVTIRRLAAAKKFHYVEEILEDQKQYKDMSVEGFNARLITLYGIAGMFHNARKVFDEMLERKCALTVMSLNALLGACVNSKKFDEVEGLLKGLSKELEIEPDLISYNTVIKAFCEMGSLDSAVSLLDEMEKKGLEPDLITFNTLLLGFYANGRFVDGEQIWDRMKEKNVEPCTRSYSARVLGMVLEKRMKDAVKVVEEMKSRGLKLDPFIYYDLIRGFVNVDDLEEAKHWYGDIGRNGCKPDRSTFETLIPFAVEKGDLAFASELCNHVILSKLRVKEELIQSVVDALAKESKIEAAMELVHLGKSRRLHSFELKLPRSNAKPSLVSLFHQV